MKLANAMPEDKFTYKPTPPQRNYGEQILHIAEANVNQMGRLVPKAAAPTIDMKATAKAAILKALEESFDYGGAALKEQTDQTLLQPAETTRFDRFMGPSTRARVVSYIMGHTWDIYGQMVVYVPAQRHHAAGQSAAMRAARPPISPRLLPPSVMAGAGLLVRDLDGIVALDANPALRNLLITQSYHDLSLRA